MRFIAERKLLFSSKSSDSTGTVTIKISEPFIATKENSSIPADGVVSGCIVVIDGIDEPEFCLYGTDSLQAISLASNIDPLIKTLSNRYDFYWSDGNPYFDE